MSIFSELNLGRRHRLPAILATEAAECGLACLAMISRYYGHDVDLNGLRQRFSLSLAGASLRSLMGIADQLGFSTRALRADAELDGQHVPCRRCTVNEQSQVHRLSNVVTKYRLQCGTTLCDGDVYVGACFALSRIDLKPQVMPPTWRSPSNWRTSTVWSPVARPMDGWRMKRHW